MSRREFYLIFVLAIDDEPPSILDISARNYWGETPLCPDGVVALDREGVPWAARNDAENADKRWGETGLYKRREYVAYRVLNPTTAKLVWRKRHGRVNGRWIKEAENDPR